LIVHDGPGLGIVFGGYFPLRASGLFVSSSVGLTLAWMRADIIDDPEDPEPGSDISSPMHPIRIRTALGCRF